MRFGNPEYFFLLAALPVAALFFFVVYRGKTAALAKFASAKLIKKLSSSAGPARYILKSTFFCLFLIFVTFALVRPKFGVKMEMVERKGVDIMIALDISHSMLAQDLAPNRLERAKLEIRRFIGLLKGDRVGLIIFAGESFVQCPLTLDHSAAQIMLQSVKTDWVQVQGTALAEVIKQANKALGGTNRKHKVLMILSDGEDHEGNVIEAAKAAARDGVVIYTIGIGSESGVPIPVNRGGSNVVYKKDKAGNLVMTRLNPVTLEKIAIESNGKYFHAGTDLDLMRIYNEISKMEKTDFGMSKAVVYEEQYQIFLLTAILFILIEFFISERTRRKEVWKGRFES
ncbi:MAG: VWA domain-containing protein [Chitinispirillia bacterium]|nr:VWA domain-containing protein [Chitinispirillia bacterium]MCL2241404.1 VWA domain-containing protein [Chitinispirillia bacterium]